MPMVVRKPEEIFTLDMLAPFLAGFEVPQEPHDPAGDWRFEYRLYSLGAVRGVGRRVGTLSLGRQARGNEAFALSVQCQRPTGPGGLANRFAAEIEARSTPLPRPTRWSWSSQIVDASGAALPESRLERSATLQGNQVQFVGARKISVAEPCTINWLLFEAVGRLPREVAAPLEFTLLADGDRLKPGHTLRYAQSLSVLLGDRPVQQTRIEDLPKGRIHTTFWGQAGGHPVALHAFYHVGEGTVPFIYWVDDQGRLLFAVAGLEAYVLDRFSPATPGAAGT